MKIIRVEKLTNEKWVNLFAAEYEHNGHTGRWVFASRKDQPLAGTLTNDAVIIVPVLRNPNEPPRLVRALTDEQIEIMADPTRAPYAKLPRIEDAVNAGGFLCGSPEQMIEHLKALEERYPGLDRISVSLSVGVPQKVALEQLERFGTEVMPAFKQAIIAEPALAD